ncbi:hypothetical protein HYPSUDRAFT_70972 [Hypholoma sublateritium FD-334 SS-4]|uniref:Uncharacterized protein n=1 Tax=Hypholoma sublateritium (strain FD-334 SS-4) TaxID=945553 RepID=A0A0D2KQV5_HYPSF|nr:hypothetical protein HYPSUDRAFT_70972 [Hypholoma sublateritium FD-334 SS-4]
MAEVQRTLTSTDSRATGAASQPASSNHAEVKYSPFLRFVLAPTSLDASLGLTECNIYDQTLLYASTDEPYFVVRSETDNDLTVMHRCLDPADVASIMAGTWEGDDCAIRWNTAARKERIQADADAKDGGHGQEGHRDGFCGASILHAAPLGVTRATQACRVFRAYDKDKPMNRRMVVRGEEFFWLHDDRTGQYELRVGRGGIFPPKWLIGRVIPVLTRKVHLEGAILWLNGEYAYLLQMCLFCTVVLMRNVYRPVE